MARTGPVELPGEQELFEILAKESPRQAVRFDYMLQYPNLYDAYKQLANSAGVNTEWIDNFANASLSETKRSADKATDKLVAYICNHPSGYDELFDTLSVNDEPHRSDCIFVFGAKSNTRLEKAVELYQRGFANKLVVSGRGPHYGDPAERTEAERMKNFAVQMGVPEDAIIVEDKSITLPDNVKRSLDLFEQLEWRPSSMINVSTTYIQRRAQLEWYKFTPWNLKVLTVSGDEDLMPPTYRRDTWAQSEQGVRLLLNEYNKIIVEQAMDLYRKALTEGR